MPSNELELRKRATAVRLRPFRGGMCDLDFAPLVNDVVRVRDKSEGRDGGVANPLTAIAQGARDVVKLLRQKKRRRGAGLDVS